MRISKVIQKPIITEKSVGQRASDNRYHFKVHLKASKGAIANEVERLFGVEVSDVKTLIMPGKQKRIGRTRRFTKTPKWKKAVVTVANGEEIKLFTEAK